MPKTEQLNQENKTQNNVRVTIKGEVIILNEVYKFKTAALMKLQSIYNMSDWFSAIEEIVHAYSCMLSLHPKETQDEGLNLTPESLCILRDLKNILSELEIV